jgi:uncharacterized protein YcfJ
MKRKLTLLAFSLVAGAGWTQAAEYGKVISSVAVVAQVAVPQQQCTDQQVVVQQPTSGAGAVMGALVGGAVGHSLGGGFGQATATGLGMVAGSVIGDQAEASNSPTTTVPTRTCQTVMQTQNQVVGYDVTYEYNGKRYSARLAQDPGPQIALNISAVGEAVPPAPATVTTSTVMAAPTTVLVAPGYGYYYPSPIIGFAPRLYWGGGYWRHRY